MFVSPDTLALLTKLGVTGLDAVAVIRAFQDDMDAQRLPLEQANAAKIAARDRKRAERARKAETSCDLSRDSHATVTLETVTSPFPRSPSPQTPQPHTPLPECVSTRAKAVPIGFDQFWLAYPRKVGKPKAQLAYASALRRLTGPDPPAEIMGGLMAHLDGWAETDPDLIPHPTTWLNRDGWNDDPPRPRNERPDRPRQASAAIAGESRSLPSRIGAAHALERRRAQAVAGGGGFYEG